MPHILARKQADGSTRYTAVVRIRRNGKILHWEVALENPTALVRAQQPSTKLNKLIRWYIDSFEHISKWQRNTRSVHAS